MTLPRKFASAVAVLAVITASCGQDDTRTSAASGALRTVEVKMVDIDFEPRTLAVEAGETIRFRFTNRGKATHDAFIGDREAQASHESDHEDNGHGGGHGDQSDDAVTVKPGDTEELTYTFTAPGTLEIGCHQPGHYAAGMKVSIRVA